MATVHIGTEKGKIAETILLPGDPLRAKFIAETFLTEVVQYNEVRNMFGFTGLYKGKKISVQGTGMGVPSIGIYSYELIHHFGVKKLLRVGSCGSFQENVKIRDLVFAAGACTNSNYAAQYELPGTYAPLASFALLEKAVNLAKNKSANFHVGNVLTSDVFYDDNPEAWKKWQKMGVLAVEMEAAALYMNAARAGVEALTLLTVSDSLVTHQATSAEERQKSFLEMMEIALETVL